MENSNKLLVEFSRLISESGVLLNSLILQFDSNNDGQLHFHEFQALCNWISRRRKDPSWAGKLFHLLDVNKDGVISPYELHTKVTEANRMIAQFNPRENYEGPVYKIALVAHNQMKSVLIEFVRSHYSFFQKQNLCSTTNTGRSLEKVLGIAVKNKTMSGPLGGDQELGGMIAHHMMDMLIFFRDPLSAHPHEADISALLRICDTTATMVATNPATAYGLIKFLKNSRPEPKKSGSAIESDAVKAYKSSQNIVIEQLTSE